MRMTQFHLIRDLSFFGLRRRAARPSTLELLRSGGQSYESLPGHRHDDGSVFVRGFSSRTAISCRAPQTILDDGLGRRRRLPPRLSSGNIINCTFSGAYNTSILVRNCAGFTAVGNLLYGAIDAVNATGGIVLRGTISGGCNGFLILGNTFENTCRTEGFNGIIIEKGSYGLINANNFRTNGVATTTAIWLTSGSSNCRVGSDNIYGSQVANRVLNQGQSNVIAP